MRKNQPVHQVVVVRRKSGRLPVLGIGLVLFLVIAFFTIRGLNANDQAQGPKRATNETSSALDDLFAEESQSRGGAAPKEAWLPGLRSELDDRYSTVSRGAAPNNNKLLITQSFNDQYYCYTVGRTDGGEHTPEGMDELRTGTPTC